MTPAREKEGLIRTTKNQIDLLHMYINVRGNKKSKNKGSNGLVHYLEKEKRQDHKNEPKLWFNQHGQAFDAYEVRRAPDGNMVKLGSNEAKFFLVNISANQKELQHLKQAYGEKDLKTALK